MHRCRFRSALFFASILALTASVALAAETISLTVDATKTPRKLLHSHEVIPVKPGPLTIYYPKWIPGEHGPNGPIGSVTGLKFEGNGKVIRGSATRWMYSLFMWTFRQASTSCT